MVREVHKQNWNKIHYCYGTWKYQEKNQLLPHTCAYEILFGSKTFTLLSCVPFSILSWESCNHTKFIKAICRVRGLSNAVGYLLVIMHISFYDHTSLFSMEFL